VKVPSVKGREAGMSSRCRRGRHDLDVTHAYLAAVIVSVEDDKPPEPAAEETPEQGRKDPCHCQEAAASCVQGMLLQAMRASRPCC
jgi:hypothetical protein